MSIDCCEDRHKFSRLCDELQIDQPAWREFSTFEQAKAFSNQVSDRRPALPRGDSRTDS